MIKYFTFLVISLLVILPTQVFSATTTVTASLEFSTSTPINDDVSSSSVEFVSTTDYIVKVDRTPIEQPNIRVGLLKTKLAIHFKSDQDYNIYSGDEIVEILPAEEEVLLSYKNGKYFLKSESLELESKYFWRLQPAEDDGFFNIVGCGRTVFGRKQSYCAYRGTLEYRYATKSKMPYLINELPLEDYMKGIAETDNNSPEGYIKAVLVAARSYAYKNISSNPPTEKRLFDVFASTQDQLYLGYASEQKMPRVTQFSQETVGEMVTYKSNVVTTPYFTHTNGQTKDWKNSQGEKDRPWLISVKCIYDKYKKNYGHGIGMSTHDALMRATKDGWGYIQLLQYYYTDTQVEKIF